MDDILSGIFRIGVVTAIDNDKHIARVKYFDDNFTSDWLPVLINHDFIPSYEGAQQTESAAGGSGAAAYENHTHGLNIRPWMPKVNEQVLVAYLPIRDGQGIILGGVQPWQ